MVKKNNTTTLMIIFLIITCTLTPVLIWGANRLLGDSSYWLISAMLLILPMGAFFLHFEFKTPKPMEIAAIAILTAITIIANILSITMVPFQAGSAMVILCGISLGPEAGCIVGMLARFGINFLYGQGSWTPWQMAAWGVVGLVAGLLFYKKSGAYSPPKRITMAIFGFFAIFFIYGGIVNFSTVVYSGLLSQFSWSALFAVYIAGVPYDLLHAFGTSIFLFCFGPIIFGAIERAKVKYGLFAK